MLFQKFFAVFRHTRANTRLPTEKNKKQTLFIRVCSFFLKKTIAIYVQSLL